MNAQLRRTVRNLALASAGLLFASSCSLPPRGSYNSVQGSENGAEVTRNSPNRNLQESIELRNIVQARKEGMLVVQVDLVNKLDRAISFQWGVEWFDRSGLVIDYGPAHYRPERFSGRQSKTVKLVAPSPEATSWKIQIGSRDEVQ